MTAVPGGRRRSSSPLDAHRRCGRRRGVVGGVPADRRGDGAVPGRRRRGQLRPLRPAARRRRGRLVAPRPARLGRRRRAWRSALAILCRQSWLLGDRAGGVQRRGAPAAGATCGRSLGATRSCRRHDRPVRPARRVLGVERRPTAPASSSPAPALGAAVGRGALAIARRFVGFHLTLVACLRRRLARCAAASPRTRRPRPVVWAARRPRRGRRRAAASSATTGCRSSRRWWCSPCPCVVRLTGTVADGGRRRRRSSRWPSPSRCCSCPARSTTAPTRPARRRGRRRLTAPGDRVFVWGSYPELLRRRRPASGRRAGAHATSSPDAAAAADDPAETLRRRHAGGAPDRCTTPRSPTPRADRSTPRRQRRPRLPERTR